MDLSDLAGSGIDNVDPSGVPGLLESIGIDVNEISVRKDTNTLDAVSLIVDLSELLGLLIEDHYSLAGNNEVILVAVEGLEVVTVIHRHLNAECLVLGSADSAVLVKSYVVRPEVSTTECPKHVVIGIPENTVTVGKLDMERSRIDCIISRQIGVEEIKSRTCRCCSCKYN